jgi:hypothetical protein
MNEKHMTALKAFYLKNNINPTKTDEVLEFWQKYCGDHYISHGAEFSEKQLISIYEMIWCGDNFPEDHQYH